MSNCRCWTESLFWFSKSNCDLYGFGFHFIQTSTGY